MPQALHLLQWDYRVNDGVLCVCVFQEVGVGSWCCVNCHPGYASFAECSNPSGHDGPPISHRLWNCIGSLKKAVKGVHFQLCLRVRDGVYEVIRSVGEGAACDPGVSFLWFGMRRSSSMPAWKESAWKPTLWTSLSQQFLWHPRSPWLSVTHSSPT